jgi:hypothetical protein
MMSVPFSCVAASWKLSCVLRLSGDFSRTRKSGYHWENGRKEDGFVHRGTQIYVDDALRERGERREERGERRGERG